MRQNNALLLTFLFAFGMSLSSCEIVGGIFKAGVWTGFIIIVVVVALIIWLISRFRK
jgi:hypothetical protein